MAVNLAEPSSPVIADRDSEETKSGKDVEETVQVVSLLERLKAPKKTERDIPSRPIPTKTRDGK